MTEEPKKVAKGKKRDRGGYERPQKKHPSKKRFRYLLGHLSFWVSGMESPLIIIIIFI